MSRFAQGPSGPELEDLLRNLDPDLGSDGDPGEHPDADDLAAWLDGRLIGTEGAEIEAHLASCGPCRTLARDVSSIDLEASSPTSPLQGSPSRSSSSRSSSSRSLPIRSVGARVLAVAALVLLTFCSFRWMTVDERLSELGVGPWSLVTADRGLLGAASDLLDGRPGTSSAFEVFAPGEQISRGESTDSAWLLSPRWEALSSNQVVWQWVSTLQPVELWVVDDREQLVLRHEIDPDLLRQEAGIQTYGPVLTYGPVPGLGPLDPDRIYAWKLNVRDAEGRLLASDFVPFRRLGPAELDRSEPGDLPALLAAAAVSEAGAHGDALRRLVDLTGPSPEKKAAVRTLLERRRVPKQFLDEEVARWMTMGQDGS